MMFISYKKLNYIILSSFLVIVILVLTYSATQLSITKQSDTIFTMSSTVKTYKTLSVDTDGNGWKDTVTVKIDDEKKEYIIEVTSDCNKKYMIEPASDSDGLGSFVQWWPLQITVADINMDKTPEIITQVSKSSDNSPLYIFRWDGRGYKCILSGSFEGLTIADVTGDGIPEVITEERIPGTGESYAVYQWGFNSYVRINYKLDTSIGGYDKISAVVKLLGTPFDEKLPSDKYMKNYFTDNWIRDTKNRQYLETFAKDIVGMQLQDYISEESGKKTGDKVKSYVWKLRYLVFRKYNTNIRAENYTAVIELEHIANLNGEYRINSIKFEGQ